MFNYYSWIKYPTRKTFISNQSISLEAPGVKRDKISVDLQGGALLIKVGGESHTYDLADDVDPKTITAHLEDGVLEIRWGLSKPATTSIAIT